MTRKTREVGGVKIEDRAVRVPSVAIFYSLFSIFLLPGCTDNHNPPATRPLTAEEKQQQALNDPFGYKTDTGKVDISGGGLMQFDKDAFKKDVDDVFNP